MSTSRINMERTVNAYPAMIAVLPDSVRSSVQSQLNVVMELMAKPETQDAARYMFDSRKELVLAMLSMPEVEKLQEVTAFLLASGLRELTAVQDEVAPPTLSEPEPIVIAPVVSQGTVIVDDSVPPQINVDTAKPSIDFTNATKEESNLMAKVLDAMIVVTGSRDGYVRFDLPQMIYLDLRAAASGNLSNVYKDVQPEPTVLERVQNALANASDTLGVDAKVLSTIADSLANSQAARKGPGFGSALLGAMSSVLSGDRDKAAVKIGEAAVHSVLNRGKAAGQATSAASTDKAARGAVLIRAAYLLNTDKAAWRAYVVENQLVPPGLADDVAIQMFNVLLQHY